MVELCNTFTSYRDGGGWTLVSKFHATGAAANLPDAVRPVVNTLSSNWIKVPSCVEVWLTLPLRAAVAVSLLLLSPSGLCFMLYCVGLIYLRLSGFSNPNERIIQSMDWERILQKGKTYELRQRTWAGVGSTFNNLIDVVIALMITACAQMCPRRTHLPTKGT